MKTPLATCLFAALVGATATAQTTETPRAGWTFRPSFSVTGGWDDNVLLVGPATEQPSDYVTSVTPAGFLDYRGKRLQLSTSYQGSLVFYQELSGLNSLDQSARGEVKYRWTPRVTVLAGQSFASAPATDGVEFIGIPFRRIGNRRYLTQTGLEVRFTPRTTMNAGYDLRVVRFDDAQQLAFPGGHEHLFSSSVLHQLSARVAVGGVYGLRRVLIIDDPAPIMLHHAAGTAEYRLSNNLQIAGTMGLSRLGAVNGQESQTGLAWRGEINARREHLVVTGYYERSMLPSFGFGGTFQNEELAAVVQGGFARNRAYWQAGAAWRTNDPLVPLEPSRESTWLNARIGYRVSPWLGIEGYYTLAHQDATRIEGKISRNRLGFQVVTTKPLRLGR